MNNNNNRFNILNKYVEKKKILFVAQTRSQNGNCIKTLKTLYMSL